MKRDGRVQKTLVGEYEYRILKAKCEGRAQKTFAFERECRVLKVKRIVTFRGNLRLNASIAF